MSDPVRFLNTFTQALATMSLYAAGHPARERAIDAAYTQLDSLQRDNPRPQFSFLGDEVVYGQTALRDMKDWEWGTRLSNAGIQRLEVADVVDRTEYENFLEEVLARLTVSAIDSADARHAQHANIKFGAIGIRGETDIRRENSALQTATLAYTLGEEIDAIQWVHDEVASTGELPLLEAESVVRSLSVAMHGDSQMVLPLLQLKDFDQYTTTHSINVSVLTMGLAEFIGLGAREVRAYGVAGLLHDLGKVRIPKDILNKPGKLSDEERTIIQQHPVHGARIIFASEKPLELAAVVAYEHHIMINGQGYPQVQYCRNCHSASHLVHVCDVYDALRTRRPYRDAWESEKTLSYIEERAGTEFEPEAARSFVAMMRHWDKRVSPMPVPAPTPGSSARAAPPSGSPAQAPSSPAPQSGSSAPSAPSAQQSGSSAPSAQASSSAVPPSSSSARRLT